MHCACCLILFMCMRVCKIMLKSKYRDHGGCDRSTEGCLFLLCTWSNLRYNQGSVFVLCSVMYITCRMYEIGHCLLSLPIHLCVFTICVYGSWNPVWHMIPKPHRPHRCTVTKRGIILISKKATKTGIQDVLMVYGIWKCTYMSTLHAFKCL
jgi:hypothetical protein